MNTTQQSHRTTLHPSQMNRAPLTDNAPLTDHAPTDKLTELVHGVNSAIKGLAESRCLLTEQPIESLALAH